MQWYKRVESLKQTLTSVAKIAIALNEPEQNGGISLRFINHQNDGQMNNITSVSEIEKAISKVQFSGGTALGTQLRRKVLEPFLVDRLERQKRKLDKPLLITIITDGEPNDEDKDELKETILWCKKYMEETKYGPFGEFMISSRHMRVGSWLTNILSCRIPYCPSRGRPYITRVFERDPR